MVRDILTSGLLAIATGEKCIRIIAYFTKNNIFSLCAKILQRVTLLQPQRNL